MLAAAAAATPSRPWARLELCGFYANCPVLAGQLSMDVWAKVFFMLWDAGSQTSEKTKNQNPFSFGRGEPTDMSLVMLGRKMSLFCFKKKFQMTPTKVKKPNSFRPSKSEFLGTSNMYSRTPGRQQVLRYGMFIRGFSFFAPCMSLVVWWSLWTFSE